MPLTQKSFLFLYVKIRDIKELMQMDGEMNNSQIQLCNIEIFKTTSVYGTTAPEVPPPGASGGGQEIFLNCKWN